MFIGCITKLVQHLQLVAEIMPGTTIVCLFSGFFQLLARYVNSLTLASVAWAADPIVNRTL